jgi:hypothetical protein
VHFKHTGQIYSIIDDIPVPDFGGAEQISAVFSSSASLPNVLAVLGHFRLSLADCCPLRCNSNSTHEK